MPIISERVGSSNKIADFCCNSNCPYCNTKIFPQILINICSDDKNYIDAIMQCPHCGQTYFESFVHDFNRYSSRNVLPHPSPQINIPVYIKNAFPKFVKIYTQAAIAEAANLSEICGMGYRKSLEALVKQYAIELFPNDKDDIEKELLMPTIKRFASPKILALATAAAWLGNDHTHLIAKHPEYDLEQLKSFINVLCQYIQSEKEIENAQILIIKDKTT